MNICLYEFCTATGLGADPGSPGHSLYREGRAMRDALADDFAAVPGVEVRTVDSVSDAAFFALAAGCAATIVIAPELDGHLERLCAAARAVGATLWNCSPDALRLTSDKRLLADVWHAAGEPTPLTHPFPGDGLPFPRVVKPALGAGSTATRLVRSAADLGAAAGVAAEDGLAPTDLIAQPFVPGTPASAAFLIGERGTLALPPALQHLRGDGTFTYEGGTVPAPPELLDRAAHLAARAAAAVPGLSGFVGIDLVLGDAADGSDDFAIEINPRLTTSYVGLRALCRGNLAAAWRALARKDAPPVLEWHAGPVRFSAAGLGSAPPLRNGEGVGG